MRLVQLLALALTGALAGACGGTGGGGDPDAGPPAPMGLPLLGNGTHAVESVDFVFVAGLEEGLSGPRDLAFNPAAPTELWVANLGIRSMVIIDDIGTPAQIARRYRGPGDEHFFAKPAAFAFGAPNRWASAPEEDQVTQDSTPEDFMGPSLWTTDRSELDVGHASHYDMLHNSPNSVGIAWDRDNIYWVFDGYHGSLTRYNFNADHGPGGADHSDGEVARFVDGQMGYVFRVVSHMEMDHGTQLLYAADTGNNRIAVLDTTTGTRGRNIEPNYDGTDQYYMDGAELRTLVDGAAFGMEAPSGLALHEGVLYVGDNATSRIHAFDLEGNELDYLDLSSQVEPGALMGLAFDNQGRLHAVDHVGNRVLRIAPLPEAMAGE